MVCKRPPPSTRPVRNAASEGPCGKPTAISKAAAHCRTATLHLGPRQTASPVMYPQTATIGTRSQGTLAAATVPTNVETAMPMLAASTATTRLRVPPWNDAIPAGSAPSAM